MDSCASLTPTSFVLPPFNIVASPGHCLFSLQLLSHHPLIIVDCQGLAAAWVVLCLFPPLILSSPHSSLLIHRNIVSSPFNFCLSTRCWPLLAIVGSPGLAAARIVLHHLPPPLLSFSPLIIVGSPGFCLLSLQLLTLQPQLSHYCLLSL